MPATWIEYIQVAGVKTDWSWTGGVLNDAGSGQHSRYQSQWFQTDLHVRTGSVRLLHSWGNGGQFVAVPAFDLVVVVTGSNYGARYVQEQKQIFDMLHRYILPAIER